MQIFKNRDAYIKNNLQIDINSDETDDEENEEKSNIKEKEDSNICSCLEVIGHLLVRILKKLCLFFKKSRK